MRSIDLYGASRRAWLRAEQGLQESADDNAKAQSDFERSVVWRGTLIAALIVVAVNIPLSPPAAQVHLPPRSTV